MLVASFDAAAAVAVAMRSMHSTRQDAFPVVMTWTCRVHAVAAAAVAMIVVASTSDVVDVCCVNDG